MKRKPSLKQQWVSERLFQAHGSLKGIAVRLRQIAFFESMTILEQEYLLETAKKVEHVHMACRKNTIGSKSSWKLYRQRRRTDEILRTNKSG